MSVRKTKINGSNWKVSRRTSPPREKCYGEVNYNTKTVYIESKLPYYKLLEICVHEILHVYERDWEEEKVTRFGRDVVRIFKKLLEEDNG